MKGHFFCAVLLAAILPLPAPCSPTGGSGRLYNMETLSVSEGLSSNLVFAITQDSTGYMWFGAGSCLNRYDGKMFRCYVTSDAGQDVRDSYINCLFPSATGELFIGTKKGLNVYVPREDKVIIYPVPEALKNQNIRALAEDKAILYIGTNNGLFLLDRSTEELTCYNTSNSGLTNNGLRTLYIDDDYIFIGTFNGLSRLGRRDGTWVSVNLKPDYFHQPLNNLVQSIVHSCFDPDILFVGTQTGLVELNRTTMKFRLHEKSVERSMVNNTIRAMCVVDNELWMGTEEGVMIYDGKSFRSLGYDPVNIHSLPDNTVLCIFKDRGNIVWLGTEAGVARYDAAMPNFETVDFTRAQGNSHIGVSVFSASFDNRNRLWMGSRLGLSVYDPAAASMRWIKLSNNVEGTYNFVKDLYLDNYGLLWMGTFEGVICYDTERGTEIAVQSMLKNRLKYIYSVDKDNHGRICFGCNDGYIQVIDYRFDPLRRNFVLQDEHLLKLGEKIGPMTLNDDFIWCATLSGIIRYDRNTAQVKYYEISSHTIHCLYINRATGELWAGTDKGFDKYDPATDRFFCVSNNNIQGGVYTIGSDNSGLLWLSTQQNLVCYDMLSGVFKKFPLWYWFNRNNVTLTTSLCDNGDVYIFGLDRYLKLNKSNIRQNRTVAPLYITDLMVNNESVAGTEIADFPLENIHRLRLAHNRNMLAFCFSMLDYSSPSATIYNYRLHGYDEQWKSVTGATPYVEYARLKPGHYMLQVNATSGEGIKAFNTIDLKIRILPPWYGTWWALILYVLLASWILFYIRSMIHRRRRMAAELQQEKLNREKIEEIDRMKLQFITNISHDFRTPLSLIVSPVETLIEEERDTARLGRLTLIRDNTLRLMRLVNQILDFRKMENVKMALESSQGDFIETMHNIYGSFTELAAKKGISLLFETNADHIVMNYDHDKVDKIFVNLISNAIKFTPEKGHVMVSVQRVDADRLEVTVADTGIGISEEDLPRIFERFYQVEESVTANNKGSGIGLVIVKEFVELHGGTIHVASRQGEGSAFIVTLPILNEAAVEPFREPENFESEQPPKGDSRHEFLILLVEDDRDMRNYLSAELEKRYDIIAFPDAESALTIMDERIPDVVISDIMLPGMSGLELCRKIKGDFLTNHIPVILLTAKSGEENVIDGFEAGSDEYIIKPFNIRVLISRIDNIIRQRMDFRKSLHRDTVELLPTNKESPDEEFIRRVVLLIEDNIANSDLSIQFLCDKLAVSQVNIYRKVKAITGISVNLLIRELKLKKAAQLLRIKGITVTDAMYGVGLNHRSYFSMSFRRMFGVTPKAYAYRYNNMAAADDE